MTRGAPRSPASLVARSVGGDPAERRRRRLLGAGVAGVVAFGTAALSVVPAPSAGCAASADGTGPSCGQALSALAPYLLDPGLRPGVVVAGVLLAVPFAVFALQVLRLGSAARERRLAALYVAGAARADLRRIARAESRPPVLGGALAGLGGYLVLWFVLGLLPPAGWRMLPAPGAADLLGWALLAAAVVLVAGVAAARAVRGGSADLLGASRRRPRPLSSASAVAPAVIGTLLVAAIWVLLLDRPEAVPGAFGILETVALPLLFVALAVTSGPWLVVLAGRWQSTRRDQAAVLAGRRLLADPRTPGRVAGVLLAVGLAVGFATASIADVVAVLLTSTGVDVLFLGVGHAMALGGIALAAVVSAASLAVGAGEQVLDGRRSTAALVALGAGATTVRRVLRVQLMAAAVVPAVVGAVLGSVLLAGYFVHVTALPSVAGPATVAACLVVACLVAAGTAAAGAGAAARLLRGTLDEAMSVESLRTA